MLREEEEEGHENLQLAYYVFNYIWTRGGRSETGRRKVST